jgi:deoxyribodipyrimidine photo-lyase
LEDNAGLNHALRAGLPVLPIFIFDKNILNQLEDKEDARVSFIHQTILKINEELKIHGSSILVKYDTPIEAWLQLLNDFNIKEVFTNNDYEPYAAKRDQDISDLLASKGISFNSFKDHVIFEKDEILKEDAKPYTIFTAYKRKWLEKLLPEFHFKSYPNFRYYQNFLKFASLPIPTLLEMGFYKTALTLPGVGYKDILLEYGNLRDYPAESGTSQLGIHLRFGTVSIRQAARDGFEFSKNHWLAELIWRDFYSMIIWFYPGSAQQAFKKVFEDIPWRNKENEFNFWCEGKTGYPIVDAGMRQLNATGWMHNRVRMITASFLTKHLLIDWRWGEAYFAKKLLDYDLASNVGGWQWAAGTGNDAAPYFRIFNPDLQTKKFDPDLRYLKKWIPEFADPFKYPPPIVEHKFARERALQAYKAAGSKY